MIYHDYEAILEPREDRAGGLKEAEYIDCGVGIVVVSTLQYTDHAKKEGIPCQDGKFLHMYRFRGQ